MDIHPPLAKLVFAAVLYALGFKGAQEEKIEWWVEASRGGFIGTKDWLLLYENDWGAPYVALRRTSAACSTAFVVVVYLTGRAVGLSRTGAAFGAWCAMGELVVLVQSRAILCDIFLYTFNMATMGASFASALPGNSPAARLAWCLATGVCLGCALSVKLTALGTLATVGLHQALCLLTDGTLPPLLAPSSSAITTTTTTSSAPGAAKADAGAAAPTPALALAAAAAANPPLATSGTKPAAGGSKKGAAVPQQPAAPAAPAAGEPPAAASTTTTPPPPTLDHAALATFALTGVARALCILLPTAFIFFGLWTLHLDILKFSGQGDNFMIEEFKGMLATKPPRAPKPGQLDPLACPNVVNTWSDCGYAGISEAQCLAAGCCWDPTSSRAWCYHLGERRRPAMAWWPKILETLRATWANNNGGAVMEHPFMSQWWEWPFMDASTVPFAATHEGGQLKALGNPAVWWGVTANFCAVTPLWLGVWALGVGGGGQQAGGGGAASSAAGRAPKTVAALGPLVIPFVVFYAGYLLNLVPYQLITRSKFVYHYIPALMQGVLLFAVAVEGLLRFSRVAGWGGAGRAAVAALFGVVLAGFWYWGIPYSYGYKITSAQNAARLCS